MRELRPLELQAHIAATDAAPMLLDVRETWEFDTCKIADSVLIPMGQIQRSIERLNPEQEIVVICHHGIRSRQVGRYLEHIGFTNIINLNGGIDAWAYEVDKSMATY